MAVSSSDNITIRDVYGKAGFSGKTAMVLSTWFGSGLLPGAPGTFGTLAGLPFVILLSYLGDLYMGIALVIIIPLAIWSSGLYESLLKKDDPSEVVIDEVAGFFIAMFLVPFSWEYILAGFLLFRIFDILKPFPIGLLDRKLKGGRGIVADDLLAGLYANICIRLLSMIFRYFGIQP